jgi:protein-S-isoprenylcysteine O-methyltransferase Ste14
MPLIDKIYRAANPGNKTWNLLKTLFHTAVFWTVFLFLLPQLIVWGEGELGIPGFSPMPVLGWIGFGLLGCLGISSGVTMSWIGQGTPLPTDCPNQLVIKGPYRIFRNPMAVAGIGQAICMGLILGSWMTIVYALSGAFFWHFAVRPSEERDLYKRFGEDYRRYQKAVWCWIPNFKKI